MHLRNGGIARQSALLIVQYCLQQSNLRNSARPSYNFLFDVLRHFSSDNKNSRKDSAASERFSHARNRNEGSMQPRINDFEGESDNQTQKLTHRDSKGLSIKRMDAIDFQATSDRIASLVTRRCDAVDDDGVVEETFQVMDAVRRAQKKSGGTLLRSFGKRTLAQFYENALLLYSDPGYLWPEAFAAEMNSDRIGRRIMSANTRSRFDAAVQVLTDMLEHRFDINSSHFALVIRLAAIEGRWEDAAQLFRTQLDGDTGMVPMDATVGYDAPLAIGLYVLARATRTQLLRGKEFSLDEDSISTAIRQRVFEAVEKMAMVSPSDRETYAFEAISALGRAREWRSCIDFLRSKEGNNLGQQAVSAVMEVCIDCGQWETALELFSEVRSNNNDVVGAEWQVGGSFNRIVSSCWNAALRAVAAAPGGQSEVAVELIDEAINSQTPLSMSAYESALAACEKDQNWNGAVRIIDRVLEDTEGVFEGGTYVEHDSLIPVISSKMISSVMRTCNMMGEYGTALAYAEVVHMAVTGGHARLADIPMSDLSSATVDSAASFSSNLRHHPLIFHSEDLLVCAMIALYEMGGRKQALQLYERTARKVDHEVAATWVEAKQCQRRIKTSKAAPRSTCDLHQFEEAMSLCYQLMHPLVDRSYTTTADVATMMRSFSAANCPNTGLLLARKLTRTNSSLEKWSVFDPPSAREERASKFSEPLYLVSTDEIAAATMEALRKSGNPDKAIDLFLRKVDDASASSPSFLSFQSSYNSVSQWVLSPHEAMVTLMDTGDVEGAFAVLEGMDVTCRTPLTYVILARGCFQNNIYSDVVDVWKLADRSRNISEELGILTLTALAHSETRGVEEVSLFISVANALERMKGLKRGDWVCEYFRFVKDTVIPTGIFDVIWKDGRFLDWEFAYHRQVLREAASNGDVADEASLLRVVELSGYRQREKSCKGTPVPDVSENGNPRDRKYQMEDRREGIETILDALEQARKTGFGNDPLFIKQVAYGLRALKANAEVVELVRLLRTEAQAEILPETFAQALHAADALGDRASKDELVKLITEAGYDYKKLKMESW